MMSRSTVLQKKKKKKSVKLQEVEDDTELLGKLGADLKGESSNCGAFPSFFYCLDDRLR